MKAEPQDIVEEAAPPPGDFDFDLPAEAPPVREETFLSADEEKLLDSFDADFEPEAPSARSSPRSPGLSPLPSIDEMPGIEESLLDEAPAAEEIEELEELGSATIDISLDDIEGHREPSPIHPDVEIDMSDVAGLDGPSDASVPTPAMEDVSAEFLDSEPEARTDDVTAQFLDVAEETPSQKPGATPEFENLDIDLHFDDTIPDAEASAGASPASTLPGFEAVTEFDDFLSSGPDAEKGGKAGSFDDIAAVEHELSAPPSQQARARETPSGSSAASDLSTEILLKIADELSSIRTELVSLKIQLGDLRHEAESVKAIEPAPSFEKEEPAGPAGGFFDEEEDETIALTGDELDNILNTADFTEEVAEAPTDLESPEGTEAIESLVAPTEPDDLSLLSEPLLPESGDYSAVSADVPAIEEISLMAEEGVLPMTEAPEDSSYLESEAKAPTPAEPVSDNLEDLRMKDVPLVEPDLSEFEMEEIEEIEPISEIEEELPLVEEAEPAAPDLTLSMEPIAEAEPVEGKPEADISHIVGIDLHEEDIAASLPEIEEFSEVEELPEADEDSIFAAKPETLDEEIDRSTVKPAEPVSLHPDEIPSTLDDRLFVEENPAAEEPAQEKLETGAEPAADDSDHLKSEIRSVLSYLDKLLDSLPEDKIEEFARSEHFDTYKRLFEELGLV